jgi:diguanylate cyclase (GGDEF)-like protein/PAS domain S-box-containing protein
VTPFHNDAAAPPSSTSDWFRALAESAPFAVFVYRDDRFLYFNQAAMTLTGYTRAELCAIQPHELLHPEDRPTETATGLSPPDTQADVRLAQRDGSLRWITIRTGRIETDEGPAVVGTAVDITALQVARQRLTQSLDYQRLLSEMSLRFLQSTTDDLERARIDNELRESRERLEMAQRAGRSVAWVWHADEDRLNFSDSADEVFGLPQGSLSSSGSELMSLVPEEDRAKISDAMRRVFRMGAPYEVEHRLAITDDRQIWLSVRGRAERNRDGRVTRVVGVPADVTEGKRAELALRQEKEKAQVTLAAIADGVIRIDRAGIIEYLNPAAEKLTGWRHGEAVGRPLTSIYVTFSEGSSQPRKDPVGETPRRGDGGRGGDDLVLLRRDGTRASVVERATPVRDAAGASVGAVLVFQDVTEVRGLEREMAYLATHDPLTGLINRREFEGRLQAAIESAHLGEQRFALCYLDLDNFKIVNDTCGHAAGDAMLRQLARVLADALNPGDLIARLGGDEFGVLLAECSISDGAHRSQRLLDAVRNFRFPWDGRVFDVRASIGMVGVGPTGGSVGELLSDADSACYVAKDHGRNQVHISEPDDAEIAARYSEMTWIQRIQEALDNDTAALFMQRIVPLANDDLTEIREILFRIIDDDGHPIEADAFLGAAERYRIMADVDRWVCEHAIQKISQHPDRERCWWAINLSGQSLSDVETLRTILDAIATFDVDPHRLLFEITETAAITDLNSAQMMMNALRGLGCRFVLDDFGAGLSSLRYLQNLEVSLLKIDGELVLHVASDPVVREMVASIRRIGDSMGIQTIGEWVESEEVAASLRSLGVHYGQGYWCHVPEPLG